MELVDLRRRFHRSIVGSSHAGGSLCAGGVGRRLAAAPAALILFASAFIWRSAVGRGMAAQAKITGSDRACTGDAPGMLQEVTLFIYFTHAGKFRATFAAARLCAGGKTWHISVGVNRLHYYRFR